MSTGPVRRPAHNPTPSDPAKVDPDAGTVIAVNGGKPLPRVNRDPGIFTEWMLSDNEEEIAVDLRTCDVWGDDTLHLPDLIRVGRGLFAFGWWDYRERRYATNPVNGYRLWQAPRREVIRWCNAGGYIYPIEFIAAPGPARLSDPPDGDRTSPPAGRDRTPGKRRTPRKRRQSTGPPVILGELADQPIVRGKSKHRLTAACYAVVMALLEAGAKGLTGDELVTTSGRGGAVNTLKALAASDRDWGAVIQLAGKPGGGYRIVGQSDGS
jgi:hypothetical protein